MYDIGLFTAALSRFARLLVAPYEVDVVLAELAESVSAVLDLAGAGVSVATDGRLRFVTAVTAVTAVTGAAGALERCQEEFQAGPCRDAYDTGQVVSVPDLVYHASRWPRFVSTARGSGIVAVAGIPMTLGDDRVGALDLYAAKRREWSATDLTAAGVFADMATGYLVNSSTLRQQHQLAEQLEHALGARVVIEQAKGILANRHNIHPDRAFDLMRAHARSHRVTVRAVATAIVELRLHL
ncbi:GAF and ANTAR domain-containing protein [Antrihabitans cavernicola]|uniref:GAF and ANTAR domain-containing protein n=1 Tax=Antrihabitans cavernicola TaxID=2495913 RepID=A0A5A7S658_9NOCA|nr:GAF and ANTAR domain-containing protein [Spelaeibacter cavernicola]KAA0017662.1 GAF and ANTAR domain-containing protein [Spelaeibacter cavernicola]